MECSIIPAKKMYKWQKEVLESVYYGEPIVSDTMLMVASDFVAAKVLKRDRWGFGPGRKFYRTLKKYGIKEEPNILVL